ncbi:MAG: hypothetical protein KDA90_17290 [Planctomycetaceae bacterium]|nr:hypothetical protein [Planctomycetaceae bacterium]
MSTSRPTRQEPPLISASTILILSGVLIGMTVERMAGNDLSLYVLSCGLAGILAFVALDLAATRRKEQQAESEKRHAEDRLDRHVMSLSSITFTLPPPQLEETVPLSEEELLEVFATIREFDLTE